MGFHAAGRAGVPGSSAGGQGKAAVAACISVLTGST